MRVGPCSRLHFACKIAISRLKVRSRRDLDPTLESTGRQLPARMSTARAFPPCVLSSPPSDISCGLWFAACASLSVCYIYDHARSAAIRAPCHRAPNIDTRCNRSFRQTLRPAVKIAKADIPRISTPSRVDQCAKLVILVDPNAEAKHAARGCGRPSSEHVMAKHSGC